MKYDEFWNGTLAEAVACVDGYLKRNEDYLRGVRKIMFYTVMPWIDKNHRGTEFDVFEINGDPTKEELEAMKKKVGNDVVSELMRARDEMREYEAMGFVGKKL